MKIRNIQPTLIRGWAITLLTLSLFIVGNANQNESISWSARLFPDNTDYVEVFVDARNIASNRQVTSARFDVAFYDRLNRLIKTQTINFLDNQLRFFKSGSYHRFFKHSNTTATRIDCGTFRVFGAAAGGNEKADSPGLDLLAEAKGDNWNPSARGRLIGSVPTVFPKLEVLVHLQEIGDRTFAANEFAGTRGESRRLEGFQIAINPPIEGLSLQYLVRVRGKGDITAKEGEFAGARGEGLPVEEFAIELTGPAASRYDVTYMAHIEDIGDTPFFKNGEFCGSRGQGKRIEGILVRLLQK